MEWYILSSAIRLILKWPALFGIGDTAAFSNMYILGEKVSTFDYFKSQLRIFVGMH